LYPIQKNCSGFALEGSIGRIEQPFVQPGHFLTFARCVVAVGQQRYEEAILRVKNGDTSAEALELVNMNYTFVKESLKTLCEYMTVAGNAKQKAEFQELANELEKLQLGHCLNEVDPDLEAIDYESFFEQRIDPNGGKKYFA
jgi:hypothetical protein